MDRSRVSQIVKFANFGEIDTLLTERRDMVYIAGPYQMDLALAWAVRVEGKTEQEKFKELDWGLRPWDVWNFNKCDEQFGDNWPGRIPAQLVALSLLQPVYLPHPGQAVFCKITPPPPRLNSAAGR